MAQPAHSTFGCVCCADMGVKVRQLAAQAQAELKARVSTDGLDQFFGSSPVVEEVITAEVVEVIEVVPQVSISSQESKEDSKYDALLKLVNETTARMEEQQAKLEAASFRIGYLEGQLETAMKGRLLPDHQSSKSIWSKLVNSMKATFAWPPTAEELADIK
ncbi:MAG: hypothetical protein K2Y22_02380 [Candidatus Obscuribacterales bacterium]|nr:hypothetical protein [Candidatus Obscuribacterales bacterium]